MENLEKENIIILAADKLSKSYIGKDKKNNKLILIAGAFMPETKEYWQQGMYSETDVLSLLDFVNDRLLDLYSRFNSKVELEEWLNTIKEK